MKRISRMVAGSLMAVLVGGGLATAKLNAQNGQGETFKVPFAFTADGHQIKPGTYEVRRDASAFLISIQNVETGDKQLFAVRPEQNGSVPTRGVLVFQQCGNRKALTEFHLRGTSAFSATVKVASNESLEMGNCPSSGTTMLAAR